MSRDEQATPSVRPVIPYFPGDRGVPDRPLPDPWYYCPSIRVGGTPGPLVHVPGGDLTVTVDVRNLGLGTAAALVDVVVWWAEASTGFATLHPFGQDVVPVMSHGAQLATTRPMRNAIPAGTTPHVCLLARAAALLSSPPPTAVPDPANQPHWAQLNLTAAEPDHDNGFDFSWLAGNPGRGRGRFELRARPAGRRELRGVAEVLGADAVDMPGMELSIEGGDGPCAALELAGGEQRRLRLRGRLADRLERGTFTAFEVAQFDVTQHREGVPVGSVGLIVRPAGEPVTRPDGER